MRKLLVLLMIGSLLVGCATSNNTKDEDEIKSDSTIALKDDDKGDKEDQEKENSTEEKEKQKEEDIAKADDAKSLESKSTSNTSNSKSETKTQEASSSNSSSTKHEEQSNSSNNTSDSSQGSKPSEQAKPVETPPVVEEPTPEPPVNQQTKADQVFAQINEYRVQNGKEPFTYSTELRSRCNSHALAMAQREALWHSGDGAECVTNYDDPFSAWVNSPFHQKLLLSNNTEAAVGIYYYNGYYYSVFQTRW